MRRTPRRTRLGVPQSREGAARFVRIRRERDRSARLDGPSGPYRGEEGRYGPLMADLSLPGDDVLPHADPVMDRHLFLDAPVQRVWPWVEQLGKGRAGWYLPRSVERLVPRRRRAVRRVEDRWLGLRVGDSVPDWGPGDPTFEVLEIERPHHLVYWSERPRRPRRGVPASPGATHLGAGPLPRRAGPHAPAPPAPARPRPAGRPGRDVRRRGGRPAHGVADGPRSRRAARRVSDSVHGLGCAA